MDHSVQYNNKRYHSVIMTTIRQITSKCENEARWAISATYYDYSWNSKRLGFKAIYATIRDGEIFSVCATEGVWTP